MRRLHIVLPEGVLLVLELFFLGCLLLLPRSPLRSRLFLEPVKLGLGSLHLFLSVNFPKGGEGREEEGET